MPTRHSLVTAALLAVLFEAAYLAAYFLRSELLLRPSDADAIIDTIVVVVGLKMLVFWSRGLCHRPWQSASFSDLTKLVQAATLCLLLFTALNAFGGLFSGWAIIPRSVLLLDWAFTVLFVGGMAAIARSVSEEIMPATGVGTARAALLIDASPAGRRLTADIGSRLGGTYFIAGLLDDDPSTHGDRVGRARVLGPVAMAPACAERLRITDIIVLQGSIYGGRLRALCDACAAIGVRISIAESGAGGLHVRTIEVRDLLSRPQAMLGDQDRHVLPFLADKVVLVTGAGGSIGAEICRQAVRFRPRRIVLLERSEAALFAIHHELAATTADSGVELTPILCDITNAERTAHVLAEHAPQVLFHAAAYKHVPLMESHPLEAIENNTLATASLAELAEAHGVQAFVALSTDKAVQPTSVMGSSKLVAERFLQAFNETSATRFVVVRFGNVLGSSGSAVPIFTAQLARRQPITITHEAVRRYFMTIDEAAQLVLLAGSLAAEGGTYVLDMGEPMRIVDLVGSLAFVMHVPQQEIRINYCGLRPGEKLDEELFFADEHRDLTENPLVIRVRRRPRRLDDVRHWMAELQDAVAGGDPDAALRVLTGITVSDCQTPPAPEATHGSDTRIAAAGEPAGSRTWDRLGT